MAFVETNPEKLKQLNDEAKSKVDKKYPIKNPFEIIASDAHKFLGHDLSENTPYMNKNGYPYAYRPMGNILQRPLLDFPWMHFAASWFTMQSPTWPRHCRIMERDYFRCVSRVGLQNSQRWCHIYWEDMLECSIKAKSQKRNRYMDRIRGKTSRPPMSSPELNLF